MMVMRRPIEFCQGTGRQSAPRERTRLIKKEFVKINKSLTKNKHSIMENNMNNNQRGQNNNNNMTRNENKRNSNITKIALIGVGTALLATVAIVGIKKIRAKKQAKPESNKEE
jgi:hypothetical protein